MSTNLSQDGDELKPLIEDEQDGLALVTESIVDARDAIASVSCELDRMGEQQLNEQDLISRLSVSSGLRRARANQLGPWDTGYIAFSGGVPVGATSNLTLHRNGAFNFSGRARVSGLPSYNFSFAWAVMDSNNPATVYLFAASGRLHGTFESGSRSFAWGRSEVHPALAAGWNALGRGWRWKWEARVNIDFGAFLDSITRAVAAGMAVGNVVKFIVSDIRLKRDIALLARREDGLGIYRYRYQWSDTVYVGVMAQEVANIVPNAVTCGPDGWLGVNYARLGQQLMTWDEWIQGAPSVPSAAHAAASSPVAGV
jgi:hypothetical protein